MGFNSGFKGLNKAHTLVVFALQTPSSLLCLSQKGTNKIFLFISHFPEAAEFRMQQFLNWNGLAVFVYSLTVGAAGSGGVLCTFCS